ncbi:MULTISPECIES: LysR substrate-binding domain-containing protein [unclassified Tolypothrix]|uniref:LysR substrate-binding domain-containing protein n=1 Tax=unclassified Tolypothrix TaxID=2649714 RepID=UPI0005EAA8C5|nr:MULTISPECIES: LysR substrate-binding domain-containing protein [unclassified Tolypothrix]BAY89083.1 transcriptional regulator LysR family protein [Microchaete diplosiphon NIES-3275]EKF06242.1 LysR family transcriptional regulator [Tolypothrix sp. PCC 7601]MBE9084620.1 LysR family transcriptional regulator [Tolypothrix sp. LEGE 11397]UYD29706.1 LysR family transcriptional regulator [Tolypothrix sp. PCC 7712]UYD34377.1 LysR family transcriptional regulator [Tolypothrix sp. PCC 7601]
MELRHLRYFIAVAEEKNFSYAAQRLHIAQPPLSQQISALEAEIGVKLFDRKKRPLQLTSAGQVFLAEARLVLTQVEHAIIQTQRASRGEIGELVVGTNSSIANSLLPDMLRIFRDRFPYVKLVLRELTAAQQIQELHNRRLDIAFDRLLNSYQQNTELCYLPIGRESLVIALPKTHPLASQPEIPLQDLAHEPFVLPSTELVPSYTEIIHLCEQAGFFPNVVQEATWMITVLSLVAGGVGVALLPSNVQNLQRQGVVYKPIQGANLTREIVVLWRQEDTSPVLHEFLKVIQELTN